MPDGWKWLKMAKLSKTFTILNEVGLHARPASMIVKRLLQFESEVFIEKDGRKVNGKSIMGILMLAAGKGSEIRVEVDGSDAQKVLDALEQLLLSKFGED
jgi:phosphocarrier protein HPr